MLLVSNFTTIMTDFFPSLLTGIDILIIIPLAVFDM